MPKSLLSVPISLLVCAGCSSLGEILPDGGNAAARLSRLEGWPEDAERDTLTDRDERVGEVSRVGDREVWTERVGHGPFTRILARQGGQTRVLLQRGAADRAVLSPDGSWVAFVYAPAGIASIGVVPFTGGEPIQLTNVGLERRKHAPGQPPEGFIPVPAGDDLIFVDELPGPASSLRLEWETSEGRVSVRLPGARAHHRAEGGR